MASFKLQIMSQLAEDECSLQREDKIINNESKRSKGWRSSSGKLCRSWMKMNVALNEKIKSLTMNQKQVPVFKLEIMQYLAEDSGLQVED